MNRYILNGIGLLAMGALATFGWAFYQVGSAIHENRATIHATVDGLQVATDPHGAGLPTIFNEARDITIALLRPCKPGKPETCGLIPSVRSVAESAGKTVTAASEQIQETQPILQAAATAVTGTSGHINKAIDAAQESLSAATDDLKTMKTPIADSGKLLEAFTQSGADLNKILERPAIPQLIDNAAGIVTNVDGISADGKKVTDKVTADFLSPQPWWKKAGRFAGDTYDYGALFARHTP